MTSSNFLTCTVLWAAIMVFNDQLHVEARISPYLETNEIIADERPIPLPACRARSICGYLQANAKGINQERICACENGVGSCPMTWDPFDGHSVTQGSDQYKMCDQAPTLKTCDPRQTAYTSRVIFSKLTEDILTKADYIKCICPESHNYELANQNFEDLDADTEVMEFSYVCAPLPLCRSSDPCKTISEKASTFLVNRKCVCPIGETCPTISEERVKSISMGSGHFSLVHCRSAH